MYFLDRKDAGKRLAELVKRKLKGDIVVYALPRGGVVIGKVLSEIIGAPLDLIITRKIGHPNSPEYAIGAVTENGDAIFDKSDTAGIDPEYINKETEIQKKEAERRRLKYLGNRNSVTSSGKTAIITDDGIATGLTMKAAVRGLLVHSVPKRIVIAVPVMPSELEAEFLKSAIEVISLIKDKDFLGSVGAYYKNFSQIGDSEVLKILNSRNFVNN